MYVKKMYWLFFLWIITAFLTSCSEKRQPAIPEDISFAATVNIKDMTISFVDLEKRSWRQNGLWRNLIQAL